MEKANAYMYVLYVIIILRGYLYEKANRELTVYKTHSKVNLKLLVYLPY